MNWEHLNITEEEFENNTNLQINIVDLGDDELLQICLDEKGIEITDDVTKADYTLENPSSADGFDLFYFGDTNYQYDFYENVFINEDSALERVWDTIKEEDNFILYMDLDKDMLIGADDEIYDLAESLGLIMRDDVIEFGDVDNPTYDEWVWVKDYDEREVELDNLYTEEQVVNSAVDRIMEDNIDSDKE
jgi:hypothetical protein